MDAVAAHLERAVELRPDHAIAHLNLGNIRREQGHWPMRHAATNARAHSIPTPRQHASISPTCFRSKAAWDAAVAAYRQALALEPNHAEANIVSAPL